MVMMAYQLTILSKEVLSDKLLVANILTKYSSQMSNYVQQKFCLVGRGQT